MRFLRSRHSAAGTAPARHRADPIARPSWNRPRCGLSDRPIALARCCRCSSRKATSRPPPGPTVPPGPRLRYSCRRPDRPGSPKYQPGPDVPVPFRRFLPVRGGLDIGLRADGPDRFRVFLHQAVQRRRIGPVLPAGRRRTALPAIRQGTPVPPLGRPLPHPAAGQIPG